MLNWILAVPSFAIVLIGLFGGGVLWELREADRRERLTITSVSVDISR